MLFNQIKATVVYSCLKVIKRLRENKTGLQTKTKGNTSTIRGRQRKNINTDLHQKTNDNATHTETNFKITIAIFLTWYRTF